MTLLSKLIGRDAIALSSAVTTGTVTGIALDGDHIVNVKLSDTTIDAGAVRSFAGDVLTYDDLFANHSGGGSAATDPRGTRVIDMHGDLLGVIADLTLSGAGRVENIVLDTGDTVAGERLRVIGSYAAIITVDLPPPTGSPVR